jgi:hypothetical protein
MRCSGPDISRLTALGSAAEQHNATGACSSKVNPIARPAINAKLPDSVTAEPMVTGIAFRQTINTSEHRHSTAQIGKSIKPLLERVPAGWRQEVFYVDLHFRF